MPPMEGEIRTPRARQLLHLLWPIVFVLALTTDWAVEGAPLGGRRGIVWATLGVLSFALATPRRLPRFVSGWAPFAVLLLLYGVLRGFADGLLFPAHITPQLDVDKFLFFGTVPTVWLQRHLWHGVGDIRPWDYVVLAIYLSHFFATLVLAGVLWVRNQRLFARYAASVCVLSGAAFVTYVLYPAVPPWLAGEDGFLPHVARIPHAVGTDLPFGGFGALFENGEKVANNVAAVPSLHAGYAFLISLFLWRFVHGPWRVVAVAYPLAMVFALVYGGEHYVSDCLLGWVYATGAFLLVSRFESALHWGPTPLPAAEPRSES